MSFNTKKIHDNNGVTASSRSRHFFNHQMMIFLGVVVGVIILVVGAKYFVASHKGLLKNILVSSSQIISSVGGNTLSTDSYGQITALIIGIGGESHQGSYNTDTMMLVTYHPETRTATMLSIPRDLYVKIDDKYYSRINGIVDYYTEKYKDLTGGLITLTAKVTEITGIPIDYYAMIDFNGFKKTIDLLGGIDVDVPETLVDTTYPDDVWRSDLGGGGVSTLRIPQGLQRLDGATALKYARSRHSTSDFDRAKRQQLIIQSLIAKATSSQTLLSLKPLYEQYKEMVTTNISLSDALTLAPAALSAQHFFSFVYGTDCPDNIRQMTPGCILYSPNREDFGGAAILLPSGATNTKVSTYTQTEQFAYINVRNPQFLLEHANIGLLNAIDTKSAKAIGSPNGITSRLAARLKQFGFHIIDVDNTPKKQQRTTLLVGGTGDYSQTITLLKLFVDFDVQKVIPSEYVGRMSDAELMLLVGDDFLIKTYTK